MRKIRVNKVLNFIWTLTVDDEVVNLVGTDLEIIMKTPFEKCESLEFFVEAPNKVHFNYTPKIAGVYTLTATAFGGYLDKMPFEAVPHSWSENDEPLDNAEVIDFTLTGNISSQIDVYSKAETDAKFSTKDELKEVATKVADVATDVIKLGKKESEDIAEVKSIAANAEEAASEALATAGEAEEAAEEANITAAEAYAIAEEAKATADNADRIFVVEYGITPLADIKDAVANGKIPVCNKDGRQFYYSYQMGDIRTYFTAPSPEGCRYIYVDSGGKYTKPGLIAFENTSYRDDVIADAGRADRYPSTKAVVDFTKENFLSKDYPIECTVDTVDGMTNARLMHPDEKWDNTISDAQGGQVCLGYSNETSGYGSFAVGTHNKAVGSRSAAIGRANQAIGSYSFAGGFRSAANGSYSASFGRGVAAVANDSFAVGSNWISSFVADGGPTAYRLHEDNMTDFDASLLVKGNLIYPKDATYGGSTSWASIITKSTKVSDTVYDIEVDRSLGTGENMTVYAASAIASGLESYSLGGVATGVNSFAVGRSAFAKGGYSDAIGYYTRATNTSEFAAGRYNVSTTSSDTAEATAFSVGNGTSDAKRSNLIEIKKNGDVYLADGKKLQGRLVEPIWRPETQEVWTTRTTPNDVEKCRINKIVGTNTGIFASKVGSLNLPTKQYFPNGMWGEDEFEDTLTPTTAIQYFERVDLSTITRWAYHTTYKVFYTPDGKVAGDTANVYINASNEYESSKVGYGSMPNHSISRVSLAGHDNVVIKDSRFTNATDFVQYLNDRTAAGDPVYLYYLKATPVFTEFAEQDWTYDVVPGDTETADSEIKCVSQYYGKPVPNQKASAHGVVRNAGTTVATSNIICAKLTPFNWWESSTVHFKMKAAYDTTHTDFAKALANDYDVVLTFCGNNTPIFIINNDKTTVDYCLYSIETYRPSNNRAVGKDYCSYFGPRILSASYDTRPRYIEIEILECTNCTVDLYTNADGTLRFATPTDEGLTDTNKYTNATISARVSGFYHSGDQNTTYAQYVAQDYIWPQTAIEPIYRYMLIGRTDTNLVPVSSSNNVQTLQHIPTSNGFDPKYNIAYYNTTATVNTDNVITSGGLYITNTLNISYSLQYNATTQHLTINKPVYLIMEKGSDGLLYLIQPTADNPYPLYHTQELPTDPTDKYYWFIGTAYNATSGMYLTDKQLVFAWDANAGKYSAIDKLTLEIPTPGGGGGGSTTKIGYYDPGSQGIFSEPWGSGEEWDINNLVDFINGGAEVKILWAGPGGSWIHCYLSTFSADYPAAAFVGYFIMEGMQVLNILSIDPFGCSGTVKPL